MSLARSKMQYLMLILLAALLSDSAWSQVWEPGYALLKNDQVMTGRIELAGEFYRIRQNVGNKVRIPSSQVRAVGTSMVELYQFKLKSLPLTPRGGDHAQLSRWCLRNNLLSQAGQHYLTLASSHPPERNPSVKQLGAEIKDKMLQQNDFRIAMGLPPLAPRSSGDSLATAAPSPVSLASSEVGTAELNRLAPPIITSFTEQIQHILINRCGQSNCHGPATKTDFQLREVSGHDAAQRTDHNLRAVLRLINTDPQAQSELLDYMTKPHGKMQQPAIAFREQSLIQDVTRWIRAVQNPVVSAEALAPFVQLNPLQANAPVLRQVPTKPSTANPSAQPEFPPGAELPTESELDTLDRTIRQQSESQTKAIFQGNPQGANIDPFDPAEFHRQVSQRSSS